MWRQFPFGSDSNFAFRNLEEGGGVFSAQRYPLTFYTWAVSRQRNSIIRHFIQHSHFTDLVR